MREIAFDTETTGLNWDQDDRIIELGAVEMINHIPTGKTFRRLINPGRKVSEATVRITGITDADLEGKPGFEDSDVVDAFLEFVGDATLVAHNAKFDRGFLNMELKRCGLAPIPDERWIDTVEIARKKFPGAQNSLDALCRRFGVDNSAREKHGALLDSEILAEVYLELVGGRQPDFALSDIPIVGTISSKGLDASGATPLKRTNPLPPRLTEAEKEAHAEFVKTLGKDAVWLRYAQEGS